MLYLFSHLEDVKLLFSYYIMSVSLQAMDCGTPGFPVLHYLPEFAQIHVHGVNDAIYPSYLLPNAPLLRSLT